MPAITPGLVDLVVEVLHNRGTAAKPDWAVGSGCLVGGALVLTAAHNVGEGELLVRFPRPAARGHDRAPPGPDKEEHAVTLLKCGNIKTLDIAVLRIEAEGIDSPRPRYGEVDRSTGRLVEGCTAIGFPRLKERSEAGKPPRRTSAQVTGEIPPGENLGSEYELLTLFVRHNPRPLQGGVSEWEGMSGAVVFAPGNVVVGVVTEHHQPEGASALGVTPVSAIAGPDADEWWALLGGGPVAFVRLPPPDPADVLFDVRDGHRGAALEDPRAGEPEPPGELVGVPTFPPPGYVERTEVLDRLRASLCQRGRPMLGLVGVSPDGRPADGIGKRVLAAALAHDDTVRAFFPDGIYWATLTNADPISGRLAEFARLLGVEGVERARTSSAELRTELAGRRCLVVLEDVRKDSAARAFQLTDGEGRTLCTTRFPSILDRLGAAVETITPLDREQAERVLTAATGRNSLPCGDEDVARILDATHQVPLALTIVGAAIGPGGRSCRVVVRELEDADDGILDRDYAVLYRAMRVGLATLARDPERDPEGADAAELFPKLAVFPANEPIPLSALGRLWGRELGDVQTLVGRLVKARLIAPGPVEGPVRFPRADRARLILDGRDVAVWHQELLDAYRELCETEEDGDWATLPREEPYIWDHLIYHLQGSGAPEELRAVALDLRFLALHLHLSGRYAVERDLSMALASEDLQDDEAEALRFLQGLIERSGHLLAGLEDLPTLASSLRLLLVDAPPMIDLGRLDDLLPPRHLRPIWRQHRDSRALRRVFGRPGEEISGFAVSVDGRVAYGQWPGKVRLADAEDGRELMVLDDDVPGGLVDAIAFSPSEACLAAGGLALGEDANLQIWGTTDGGLRPTPREQPTSGVLSLAFSRDGRLLAAGSRDGDVRIWDLEAGGKPVACEGGHGDAPVTALAFAPDGGLLSAGEDGRIRLWDPATGQERQRLDGHVPVKALAASNDGRLAWGGLGGTTWIRDLASGREWPALQDCEDDVSVLAFSPSDGRRLASGSLDRMVRICDADDGHRVALLAGHRHHIVGVAFSPDGRRVLSADGGGTVRIWDAEDAEDAESARETDGGGRSEDRGDWINAIAGSLDGSRVASGGDHGRVRIWSAATSSEPLWDREGHAGWVYALDFSPDGDYLASGGDDRDVRIWDAANGAELTALRGGGSIRAVAFDRRLLAAACGDGSLQVWEWNATSGGRPLWDRDGHLGPALALVVTGDGRLVSGGADGHLRAWGAGDGEAGPDLVAHSGSLDALALSPAEGGVLASGGGDGRVHLWDIDSLREPVWSLDCWTGPIGALAFSADGRFLLCAGANAHLQLVDLSSRATVLRATAGEYCGGLVWTAESVALLLDNALVLATLAGPHEG